MIDCLYSVAILFYVFPCFVCYLLGGFFVWRFRLGAGWVFFISIIYFVISSVARINLNFIMCISLWTVELYVLLGHIYYPDVCGGKRGSLLYPNISGYRV